MYPKLLIVILLSFSILEVFSQGETDPKDDKTDKSNPPVKESSTSTDEGDDGELNQSVKHMRKKLIKDLRKLLEEMSKVPPPCGADSSCDKTKDDSQNVPKGQSHTQEQPKEDKDKGMVASPPP